MLQRILAAVALAVLLVPGCFGSDYSFEMDATKPFIVDGGYSYDGATVRAAESGSVEARLKDEDNSGRITARVVDRDGTAWKVEFVGFSGTPDRQGGGVRQAFTEHGATGNGSTALPEFFAYAAAWGTAVVTKDGQGVREPNTLTDEFPAHLMVSRGMVRDPDSHQIYKGDGTCCYDPARPEDAQLASDAGAQAILEVKTRTGALFLLFEFQDVRITKS